jgi:succinoglycan biosynthesis transport protein ExoP
MSFLHFINLLFRNILWLIVIPVAMAGSVYYFTRHEKKVFSSETVIYTGIASGYNLSGSNKADFFATSNAFDNLLSIINSRETKQQVAVELLSAHLFEKKHNPALLSWGSYDALMKLIPDSIKQQIVKPTLKETIDAVGTYMLANDENLIYRILNSDNPFYSVNALQNIKAIRISSSDLIKVSYETNDAIICKHTLEILVETFIKKHKLLREGQTDSVIAYFEKQVNNSFKRLDSVEQVFLDFNKQNEIINYNEQTKAVAGEKENLYAQNHNLEMDNQANGSALNKLNENIKGRLYQELYGPEIVSERSQLSAIYNKIALSEVMNKNNTAVAQRKYLDSLRNISAGLEKKLKVSLDKLYADSNTPNGIPTKTVLDEWLKSTLAFEESKARLTVMDKRKKEFADEFKKLAPVGAILKKLDRQITVSEQEYLELLHGLSQAKLTQQNNELTSKLTIIDPPYLPLKANPSKRIILIIVSFMAGFFLVLAFLLTRSLINKTLQEPVRAQKLIGIPIAGIYPLLKASPDFLAKANLRLVQQLLSQINQNEQPAVIGITSIQKGEGKSTIASIWEAELKRLGMTVKKESWHTGYQSTEKAGIVLLELPALEEMVISKGILPGITHVYLVCRANRVWNKMDKELISLFKQVIPLPLMPLLNGVSIDFAEDYIGEVTKRRTGIRSMFKRLVKFEFGNRKRIR